jgi:Cof subfamily protein (haloacid dehalogenase superfamily)
MAPRLVALDVDGTLLTTDETLSARNRQALARAEARGWHVVLVTGRPLAIALPVVHDLGLGEYVVAANGSTVAHASSGEVVHQSALPAPIAIELIEVMRRAVPGLGVAVTTARRLVHERGFEAIAPQLRSVSVEVADASPEPDDEVHSVLLFVPGADALELVEVVAPLASHGVTVSPSGLVGSVELAPADVNKAFGLARLCEHLGLSSADVVAFGDGLNDIAMLQWAGIGVAMGNAHPDAKVAADEVTLTNDEDGVAVVVERLLAVS